MFRSLVIAGTALVATSAFAADLGYKKPAPVAAVSAMCKEKKALPVDAFGFATGSDVADLGAWGAGFDNAYVAGGRRGKFYSYTGVAQVSGSFFPCFEVGPYLFVQSLGSKPYGGLQANGSVIGGGVEMKYKLLGRATHGVGMTLAVNPNFGGYNGRTFFGASGNSRFNNSIRLLVDGELMKDKLYGALNIELFQNAQTNSPLLNTSTFAVRGALSYAVTDSLYLGAESSYQVGKTGMWANGRFLANAVYVGPTFLWAINDKWTLNGTWATQVLGNDKSGPATKLGSNFFPVNQARVKLAYTF